jgi:hypothetical protein
MAAGILIVWSGWAPLTRIIELPAKIDREHFPDDDRLSRKHCLIQQPARAFDIYEILDLGSRNGTFVVHQRVDKMATYWSGTTFRAGHTVGKIIDDVAAYAGGPPPGPPVAPPDVVAAVFRAVARAREGIRIHATAIEWYLWRRWLDVAAVEDHAAAAALLAEDMLRPDALWKVAVPTLPSRCGMLFAWSGRRACNVAVTAPATIGRAQLPDDDTLAEQHLELAADGTVTTLATASALHYINKINRLARIGNSIGSICDDIDLYADGGGHYARTTTSLLASVAHELGVEDQLDADIAEWALNEHRWEREELRTALRDRLAGNTVETFAQLFERIMKAPPPFPVPPDYEVLSSRQLSGKTSELMIGSGSGTTLLVQADIGAVMEAPVGWFQAGFWGHGVNSYAFYYGRVTEHSRIYLRVSYGEGAYVADPEAHRTRALAKLRKYIPLGDSLPCKHVTLVQSMDYAHWRIERLDGTVAEMEHKADDYFSSLDTFDFEAIAKCDT